MLSNYKELSGRYIRYNKKRTILTLLGIVLSLALISTIGLFLKSGESSQLDQAKRTEGTSAHLSFLHVTEDVVTKVSNNPNVARYGFYTELAEQPYQDITFQMMAVDEQTAQMMEYSLKEGRMPQTENELCIEQWINAYITPSLSLGDSVELDGISYQVVGFLNSRPTAQDTGYSRAITYAPRQEDTNLMVEIRQGKGFEQTLKTLRNLAPQDARSENTELIHTQQLGTDRTLKAAAWIVIGIVIASTIIVIYNAFQISLVDRLKQFGLLRSIGATKKQIRSLVFREATLLWVMAAPLGLGLSIGAIYGLQWFLNVLMDGASTLSIVEIDCGVLAVSTLLMIVTVYASSFLPAYYVGKISPLAAISSQTILRKEKITHRKSKILPKILNFKMRLTLKNVWRNPKRCMVMILSIVVSATLFITFSTLMQEVIMLRGTEAAYQNIDLEISLDEAVFDDSQRQPLLEEVSSLENVERVYLEYPSLWGSSPIAENKKVKDAGNIYTPKLVDGTLQDTLFVQLDFFNEAALDTAKQYLTSGSIDPETMAEENGVVLISHGTTRDQETNKRYTGRMTAYQVGDEIVVTDSDGNEYTVKVCGIVEQNLFHREETSNTLLLFSTNAVRENLTQTESEFLHIDLDLKDSKQHLSTNQDVADLLRSYPGSSVVNFVDVNNMQHNSILLIQVLVYGFLFVITLISSLNIVNTVTMNITLRRRELSVLKSIGMSQRDLKTMILYEGIFYGLIGGTIGAVAGCGFTYAIYDVLEEIVGLEWKAPLGLSVITIAVAVAISLLSALLPLKKIEKDNIIDAIREE